MTGFCCEEMKKSASRVSAGAIIRLLVKGGERDAEGIDAEAKTIR